MVIYFLLHILAAVTCPAVTLGNGTLSGNCSGKFNDTCMYASCDAGFKMTNGSVTRVCQQDGAYSGTAISCIREP